MEYVLNKAYLILAVLFAIAYGLTCFCRKQRFDLKKCIASMGVGVGVETGLFLLQAVFVFESDSLGKFKGRELVMLVNSAVVFYFSSITFIDCFGKEKHQ